MNAEMIASGFAAVSTSADRSAIQPSGMESIPDGRKDEDIETGGGKAGTMGPPGSTPRSTDE